MAEHLDPARRLDQLIKGVADFFRIYPQDEAVKGVVAHIRQFWTPRMRADFIAASTPSGDALIEQARAFMRDHSA
ncbi:MAG: formate dehydrogenase subunit delta [Hyphomicrobiales bacterium]|nr:formate dehydrogenase subunit delta [Hyphomicrobiales bacterium]